MHNGAPQLVFDEKFAKRPAADQIDYLKKLCSSQNHALDLMQQERDALQKDNALLKQAVENAESAFYIQKDIVANLLTKTNADDQQTHERIRDLEKRLEAQGGDIN